jgi:hypothetical protein
MLELEDIKKLVRKPRFKAEVSKAIEHHSRLRFHTEPSMSLSDVQSSYYASWIGWVKKILPDDKWSSFESFITFPLPTTELMRSAWNSIGRVFEARDAVERYKLPDSASLDEFKKMFDPVSFKRKAFSELQTSISSLIVCDMPEKPSPDEEPGEKHSKDPYYYFLPIEKLIDLDAKHDGTLEWVIFKDGDGKVIAVDEVSYKVFEAEGDNLNMKYESKHGLDFCPVRFFWSDNVSKCDPINKIGPATLSLGNLDWLLFFEISKRYLESYASYPMIYAYEVKETFSDVNSDALVSRDSSMKPSGRRLRGPGSFSEVSAPSSRDDVDLMTNPVKVVPAEINSLNYNVEECDRLKSVTMKSIAGYDGEPSNEQAKNEKQVQSGFESRRDVLLSVARNIAAAHKWTAETLAKMKWAKGAESIEVSYGTQFYLDSENDILTTITTAKENGAPDAIVEMLSRDYFDTKYRGDATARQRVAVLMDLDPFPALSTKEVMDMFKGGAVTLPELSMKINLSNFVRRFEMENGSVIVFGSEIPYRSKIEKIKLKLNEYASQQEQKVHGS